ncbi:MAG: DNA methyltransferase [Candidatus Eisenbacteria bacterium]|nr:DNA methyltransferase [Candidatus Latescibacterota bacterium]MBD3301329.1 DNA methyltransferase [Candidatus Eisenbacteria bacterium]
MIKYIGSKRRIVPGIVATVAGVGAVRTVLDPFSGTTRVAQGLKAAGFRVHASDLATYSEVLGTCYVETDRDAVDPAAIERLLRALQATPAREGYFTETFCRRSRYFHPRNGARIDAIREEIDRLDLDRTRRSIALTSLLEAADRVDSTTGLQMAFLKSWAPRALSDLQLRPPRLLSGSGRISRCDANRLVRDLATVDLAYLDPPYNQHSFFRNYHVWETLVRNDAPEVYGIACKRLDCRERRSPYNSRTGFGAALRDLLANVKATYLLLSCNSEGYLDPAAAPGLLERWGAVGLLEIDAKRYVGAQIGIHNPRGEKVGRVTHLRNREYLFLAGPDPEAIERGLRAGAEALGPAALGWRKGTAFSPKP